MNLKQLFNDDNAVSPVIGVILMVAITVILAAVIGTFVLGLGDNLKQTSPTASFSSDYTQDGSGDDTVELTHGGGDTIDAARLSIIISGATDGTNNVDPTDPLSWTAGSEASAGSSVTITDTYDSWAGAGTSSNLDLSEATVKIVWTSESGDKSATIATWSGPDA